MIPSSNVEAAKIISRSYRLKGSREDIEEKGKREDEEK